MKIMKKLLSLMLVLTLVLTQFVPLASAASGKNSDTGKITISNAISGQTYAIYQILQLESYDTAKEAYTYKATDTWKSFVESSKIKGVYLNTDDQGYVTWKSGADQKEFSRIALEYATDNSIAAEESIKASSTTVEFKDLNLGYYLVDSSLGALCGLTTTNPEATVNEKNEIPTVEKKVKEGTIYGSESTAKIGDKVEYKTTIHVKKGAQNYVLHDVMDEGLTYNNDAKVFVNDEEVAAGDNTFEITKKGNDTFTIIFEDDYIFDLIGDYQEEPNGVDIVVTYSATLNEKAVICGTESCTSNDNETYLSYGDDNESNHDETKTYSYEFTLIKTDGTTQLEGAEFTLYDAAENGNQIKVFEVSTGVYRVAYTDAEKAAATNIVVGSAIIEGLDENISYYLQEEVAPNGYNKLASRQEVTLNKHTTENNVVTATKNEVSVVNNKGTQLPSTGGMGTVLFITIGSIMVLGFGVLLVTKLRMSKMSL